MFSFYPASRVFSHVAWFLASTKSFASSLLLRRFAFLIIKATAKREWLVMNRKGPWEGYRRRAHIFIERETSGYEAGSHHLSIA